MTLEIERNRRSAIAQIVFQKKRPGEKQGTIEIERTRRGAIATSSLTINQKSSKKKPKIHPKINEKLFKNQSWSDLGEILGVLAAKTEK